MKVNKMFTRLVHRRGLATYKRYHIFKPLYVGCAPLDHHSHVLVLWDLVPLQIVDALTWTPIR